MGELAVAPRRLRLVAVCHPPSHIGPPWTSASHIQPLMLPLIYRPGISTDSVEGLLSPRDVGARQ